MKNSHRSAAQDEADFNALCDAFLQLRARDEYRRFLQDLCTPAEIKALAERWRVANLLDKGELSYREIHARTGVSVTTVGRVARFLQQEPYQGYAMVIERQKAKR